MSTSKQAYLTCRGIAFSGLFSESRGELCTSLDARYLADDDYPAQLIVITGHLMPMNENWCHLYQFLPSIYLYLAVP